MDGTAAPKRDVRSEPSPTYGSTTAVADRRGGPEDREIRREIEGQKARSQAQTTDVLEALVDQVNVVVVDRK